MVAPRSRPDAAWVSVNEAAGVVGRSRRTIYKWIADGLLRTRRVAGGPLQVEVASLFQDEGEPADPVADVPAEGAPVVALAETPDREPAASTKGTSAAEINREALECADDVEAPVDYGDDEDELIDVE